MKVACLNTIISHNLDLTLKLTTSISVDTVELQFTLSPCVAIPEA